MIGEVSYLEYMRDTAQEGGETDQEYKEFMFQVPRINCS